MENFNWELIVTAGSLILGVVLGMWKIGDKVSKAIKEIVDVGTAGVGLIQTTVESFLNDKKIDAGEWEQIKQEHDKLKQELAEAKEAIKAVGKK